MACSIFILQPETEPRPMEVKAPSPNHTGLPRNSQEGLLLTKKYIHGCLVSHTHGDNSVNVMFGEYITDYNIMFVLGITVISIIWLFKLNFIEH